MRKVGVSSLTDAIGGFRLSYGSFRKGDFSGTAEHSFRIAGNPGITLNRTTLKPVESKCGIHSIQTMRSAAHSGTKSLGRSLETHDSQ